MAQRVSFAGDVGGTENGEGSDDKNGGGGGGGGGGGMVCPNCGSRAIEQHEASGSSVCVECGVVVEENAIVSSVQFVESDGGASSMVGQFVSQSGSRAGGGRRGGMFGFGRDSREVTLANGRRRIQDVASRLRLGSRFVDAAHRWFTIAVEKNFVHGRRSTHVVAACLYVACRQEKSQHMLIDFSDALQVNVYTLGSCFLKFRRLLGIPLEIIDPALYIYRFAAHLQLDDRANAVGLTALRLVGRMKRDWIVAGRRPAGICAAALLIAARAHGFDRANHDVTRILRVCGMTVKKRVQDFEATPSSKMTLQQFHDLDIETEADPPVFTRNRIREARAKAIQDKNLALLTSGALDDPRSPDSRRARWRESRKSSEKKQKFDKLYETLEEELEDDAKDATPHDHDDDVLQTKPSASIKSNRDNTTSTVSASASQDPHTRELANDCIIPSHIDYPLGNNGTALVLHDRATPEELRPPTKPTQSKIHLETWKSDMPHSTLHDIEGLFRDDDEVKQREAIFNCTNKEYLKQRQQKQRDQETLASANNEQQDDDAKQLEQQKRYRKRSRSGANGGELPTTEEALISAVSSRKVSRKINYDALSSIFDDSGKLSTEHLDDGPIGEEAGGAFEMV